jgi:hypothetical protein
MSYFQKILIDDFYVNSFTVYYFPNFDFQLANYSLNNKKHFHKKSHPFNLIFKASS